MCSSSLSSTSALDGGGWSTLRSGQPGNDPVPIVEEAGLSPEPACRSVEKSFLPPTGFDPRTVQSNVKVNVFVINQQAVQCFHIFLRPSDNYIIFFLQLPLSFQSFSINPLSLISPLIPSAQVSLGLPRFLLPGGLHFITSIAIPPLPFSEQAHAIGVVLF